MNILELCLSPDLGGLELFMVSCYKNFSQKDNCMVVVQRGSKLDNYLQGDEGTAYLSRNKFFPILPALKLARIIDANDIDLLHFHWTKDIATVVLAKLLSHKKPKLVQTRNMTMTRFKDDFYHKWLYKNIDLMHAVTHQVAAQIERFVPQDVRPKTETVYMGTQVSDVLNTQRVQVLKKEYGLNDEAFVVGIVGRIEEGKGQWILIEALAQLAKKDMKALIVGHTMDDAYLKELQELVKRLHVEEQVIFTGFTKEVREHFALMDVNVLATKKETFGLVVIEAMASKVCMVATNQGGPLEIIEDGVDGLLFERNVEDLSQKLLYLYQNREKMKQMAQKGYEKVLDKFDEEKQLEKLYRVLR